MEKKIKGGRFCTARLLNGFRDFDGVTLSYSFVINYEGFSENVPLDLLEGVFDWAELRDIINRRFSNRLFVSSQKFFSKSDEVTIRSWSDLKKVGYNPTNGNILAHILRIVLIHARKRAKEKGVPKEGSIIIECILNDGLERTSMEVLLKESPENPDA